MARVSPPGNTEVYWVVTITDYTAPTSTLLNTNVDLTSFCRGVPSIPETGNTADTSNLSSGFNSRQAASYGGDNITLEMYRDNLTDTAFDTLTRGLQGHLVVAWDGLATAGTFAIGDDVWVYECTVISRGAGVAGRDEVNFFVSEMAITNPPAEKFTLVA